MLTVVGRLLAAGYAAAAASAAAVAVTAANERC